MLKVTKKRAAEENERLTSGNNIIIYCVPETNDALNEERTKHDKLFCSGLLKDALEVEVTDGDIKKIFRLCKRDASATTAGSILRELRERGIKNRIMESLYKLKQAEEKFKNVPITHDLILPERTECKVLVLQAKRKHDKEEAEWLWRVRGAPVWRKLSEFRND